MILGSVAASQRAAPIGSGSINPYPSSLAYFNFITGQYFVGAASVLKGDIINHPERIGVNGLELSSGESLLIGDAKNAFLVQQGTIIVEFDKPANTTTFRSAVTIEDRSDFSNAWIVYTELDSFATESYGDTWGDTAFDLDSVYGLSRIRIAATRDTGKLSVSGNGRAFATVSYVDGVMTPDTVALGGTYAGYIREVILFSPLPDSDLPALSIL